ncbi:LOW QUALITY PROTEIN: metal transporter CNNM3-like [Dermochelys coriacea]|uniref:LOW QUALITY PROTEIN: metal transporter CNNM3-like n=1 Tax=Dermochelys coriacea TaxID=27794 RepID=UPI001CA962DD|nr:LOW QUALITY PROTEIN: metal transporter CNNM3-like [Dermochelys coriacea]
MTTQPRPLRPLAATRRHAALLRVAGLRAGPLAAGPAAGLRLAPRSKTPEALLTPPEQRFTLRAGLPQPGPDRAERLRPRPHLPGGAHQPGGRAVPQAPGARGPGGLRAARHRQRVLQPPPCPSSPATPSWMPSWRGLNEVAARPWGYLGLGRKSHLAIVQKVNNEGEGDPFYEAMGLVMMEDVIEEIIRSEILDDLDDYKSRDPGYAAAGVTWLHLPCLLLSDIEENKVRKRPAPMGTLLEPRKEDFSLFKGSDNEHKVKISPQLLLATQRFLSRAPQRQPGSEFNESDRLAPEHYLYQRNQPVNYFVWCCRYQPAPVTPRDQLGGSAGLAEEPPDEPLASADPDLWPSPPQGRLEVEIGKEGLKFENGAVLIGVSALMAPSSVHQSPVSTLRPNQHEQLLNCSKSTAYSMYCPDYTVGALTDLQFIKVTRLQYLNAPMVSRIQPSPESPDSVELKIVPNSQTKLLDDRNTLPAAEHLSLALCPATHSFLGTADLCS